MMENKSLCNRTSTVFRFNEPVKATGVFQRRGFHTYVIVVFTSLGVAAVKIAPETSPFDTFLTDCAPPLLKVLRKISVMIG